MIEDRLQYLYPHDALYAYSVEESWWPGGMPCPFQRLDSRLLWPFGWVSLCASSVRANTVAVRYKQPRYSLSQMP